MITEFSLINLHASKRLESLNEVCEGVAGVKNHPKNIVEYPFSKCILSLKNTNTYKERKVETERVSQQSI